MLYLDFFYSEAEMKNMLSQVRSKKKAEMDKLLKRYELLESLMVTLKNYKFKFIEHSFKIKVDNFIFNETNV